MLSGDNAAEPLQHVATLMECTSEQLVHRWERSEGTAHTADADEALHRNTLALVLAHRPNDVAKQRGAQDTD